MQREPAELPGQGEPGGADVPGERVRRRPDEVRHPWGHRDGRARREDPAQARRRPVAGAPRPGGLAVGTRSRP